MGDQFFLALPSLKSDYSNYNPLAVNECVGSRELGLYRNGFMLTKYALGYLIYPFRIVRAIRNMWFRGPATTVIERCLNDQAKRRAA